MGVYDRDYYRNDPPARGGLLGGPASTCKWLIAINIVVFMAQVFTLDTPSGGVTEWLILRSDRVLNQWEVWRLLTYAFCHSPDDVLHLVGNMLFLWLLGSQIEPIYGQREFLRFYLTAAVLSGLGYLIFQAAIDRPSPMLGASGAVMAVTMVCAMYYPTLKIRLFLFIPIELRWLVVIYVIFDMFPLLRELGGANPLNDVAHSAHLAGLLYGFLYKRFDLRYSRVTAGWDWPRLKRLVRTSSRRKPEGVRLFEPTEQNPPTPDLTRRVDEILAKISEQGESSLTENERDILKEASHRYKNKR